MEERAGNGTVFLLDSPPGIYGQLNAACTRIDWADGVGSVWTRPAPTRPFNATISNVVPRRDDAGNILRVQDGCLQRFNGVYYMYGARYQCCPVDEQPACYQPCGWRNATFAVYSSPDLTTWHLESGSIFPIVTDPDSPHSNTRNAYFEPCVMYSAAADHYALWFLNTNTKAVAVSDSPTGPFESVTWDVGLHQGSDSYFWQDANDPAGTTYVKHNGPPPPGEIRGSHYVSRLAPDLLSVLPNASSDAMMVPAEPVPPAYQGSWPQCSEGGGLFSQGGRWFVMAAVCECHPALVSAGPLAGAAQGPARPRPRAPPPSCTLCRRCAACDRDPPPPPHPPTPRRRATRRLLLLRGRRERVRVGRRQPARAVRAAEQLELRAAGERHPLQRVQRQVPHRRAAVLRRGPPPRNGRRAAAGVRRPALRERRRRAQVPRLP